MTQPKSNIPKCDIDTLHRLFGHCIIKLQFYELTLKSFLANSDLRIDAPPGETWQLSQGIETAGKTLGALVQSFTQHHLRPAAPQTAVDEEDCQGARMKIRLNLCLEEAARLQSSLAKLVALRNDLVHHFFEGRDLSTPAAIAQVHCDLRDALAAIEAHFQDLRQLVEDQNYFRQKMHRLLGDKAIRDSLTGKSILWPITDIVQQLQEAASNGWTPLDQAVAWIITRHPDQSPTHYGCKSWQHLLHASRLFNLRYDRSGKKPVAFYQPKPSAVESGICDAPL